MKSIVITSTRKSAGKSSIIVGLGEAMGGKKIGYMKPAGDRLLYKKKRLWDYDAALMTDIFGLSENPEEITIGFEHSKLRFMYDEAGIAEKLKEISAKTGNGKDLLFIEGGMDLSYGISVNLDAIHISKVLGAKLVAIVEGEDWLIDDDIFFLKKRIDLCGAQLAGVIINKVKDVEDYKQTHLEHIAKTGIPVLGIIPYAKELNHTTVGFIAESLFAKVLTGNENLSNVVDNIFVGAMSAEVAYNNPLFKKENKLIITSGDRADMIVTAVETGSSGIIITNSFVPASHIIAKATEKKVPLLLVGTDTYQTAKHLDNLEPLLMKEDADKIALWKKLVSENVNIKELT